MKLPSTLRPARGFSLIEVLIAVVILTVGLLALASLQMSLIRSSADTKSQSIAMALAKQRIEQLRSFQAIGGTDNSCVSPINGGTNTCYRAIADENATAVGPVGGVQFERAVAVGRYVYNKATGIQAFQLIGSDTGLDSTLQTNPATYLAGKEFKRVAVTVSWIDATGTTRSLVAEDAIAAFNPGDAAAVSKTTKGSTPRPAKSVITNPASVAGVIPIAIGSGTDTAATNPRPVIVSQGQNSTVVETRFDVYTYAAINGTSAEAQSRVETSVVGCRCTKTAATQVATRPTYWDGFKYTTPTTASGIPVSVQASGQTQSDYCTECCRDHHDPGAVTGAKFDPRRSTHSHFLNTDLANAVTGAGTYDEACRLIRVDGIFRVAADSYNDDFILLPTSGLTSLTPTTTVAGAVPASGTGSVSSQYQAYVVNYLDTRFSSTNKNVYNTAVDPTARTNYSALQSPSVVGITSSNAPKYLHARGLYIDYLETEVRDIVKDAFDNCPTGTPKTDCILKYLPFTSINISELATWTSSTGFDTKLEMSNNGFPLTIDDPLPVRGKATLKNAAAVGDSGSGVAAMQRSSAGLALANPVFPVADIADANVPTTDSQAFLVGTVSYANTNGHFFYVDLAGTSLLTTQLTVASPADVRFTIGSEFTCNAFPASQVARYKCIPGLGESLPSGVQVKVGNYNRDNSVSVGNPCSNSAALMSYKKVYDVTGATSQSNNVTYSPTLNNSTGSIAAGGEYTTVDASTPPLVNEGVITVTFGSPSFLCPSNWATYITNTGAKIGDFNNTQKQANCSGNGNKDPNFNTTFTTGCPTGFAPFNGN
jgi:prepilin-type N-terminal cleavage/methylation domain-containing protein